MSGPRMVQREPLEEIDVLEDDRAFVFDKWDRVIGGVLIGIGLLTLAVRWLT